MEREKKEQEAAEMRRKVNQTSSSTYTLLFRVRVVESFEHKYEVDSLHKFSVKLCRPHRACEPEMHIMVVDVCVFGVYTRGVPL